MSFISLEFVLLLLLCFTLYHFVREKGRKLVLLAASGVFIGYFNPVFLVTALVVSLFTYGAAIRIERACEKGRGSRLIYWSSISCLVLCWIGFRYAHQLTGNSGIVFPLGMSFYTFQAIGYLTEVYWEEEKAERKLMDFLLYMLLFMKFLSGPIERSADLLPQVRRLSPASYSMMTYGLKLIVVGLVKKLVLADHIAPYIDGVFDSMHTASGVQLLMACLLYPIELYADFSGYTDMAIGTGMLFGLKLSPNFAHPFAAQTTAEFWRRWHISLSSWVRDYLFLPVIVYSPLGTRRCGGKPHGDLHRVGYMARRGMDICRLWIHTGTCDCVGTEDGENTEQGKETYRGTAVHYAFGCPHLPYFCRIAGVLQGTVCFRRVLFPAEHLFSVLYELERNQYRHVRPHLHRSWQYLAADAAL